MDTDKILSVTYDVLNDDSPENALKNLIVRDDLSLEEKVEVLRLVMYNVMQICGAEAPQKQKKLKTFKPVYQEGIYE